MDTAVSLTPESAPDALAAAGRPPQGATIVELRADLFEAPDLRAFVNACPLPVLVTLRSAAEGGRGPTDPQLRRSVLAAARDAGAALIDLEYERDLPHLDALGLAPEQVVLSWHDPTGTPGHLAQIAEAMLEASAALVKVVPTARRLADLEPVLGLYPLAGRRRIRLLAFAMGSVGVPTRYLAPLLGAPIAFAAWRAGAAAAPGQLTPAQIDRVIGHLEGPPQRLFGVVGADVTASLSPPMHAAGYRAERLPYVFLPVTVPEEAELHALFVPQGSTLLHRVGLPAFGWAVTAPYKDAAARAATLAAPRVRRSGAANTLILKAEQVIADNTDADGVVAPLIGRGIDPDGCVAVVQGTGGAARGAAVGLDAAGATVVLRGREPERTQATAAAVGVHWCPPHVLPEGVDLLVNATPLGGRPDDECPFDEAEVAGCTAVLDMVYADRPTRLAEVAAAASVPLIDGREILLHQGFAQFAAHTGRLPPKEAMRRALARTDER